MITYWLISRQPTTTTGIDTIDKNHRDSFPSQLFPVKQVILPTPEFSPLPSPSSYAPPRTQFSAPMSAPSLHLRTFLPDLLPMILTYLRLASRVYVLKDPIPTAPASISRGVSTTAPLPQKPLSTFSVCVCLCKNLHSSKALQRPPLLILLFSKWKHTMPKKLPSFQLQKAG